MGGWVGKWEGGWEWMDGGWVGVLKDLVKAIGSPAHMLQHFFPFFLAFFFLPDACRSRVQAEDIVKAMGPTAYMLQQVLRTL